MTFSLIGRCERSGMFGVVVTSSSPCVASRCAWARAGAGAVATQNVTDPWLGHLGLELLGEGLDAGTVLALLVRAGRYPEHRQLTVIDTRGEVASHDGAEVLGRYAGARGEGCIAAGNLLANDDVPGAMVAAFEASADAHLAERLVRAVEAGESAGGEAGEVRSAGAKVVHETVWPIVDLRVDWDVTPIPALRALWTVYAPQVDDYVMRAADPTRAPSYGVPGDL